MFKKKKKTDNILQGIRFEDLDIHYCNNIDCTVAREYFENERQSGTWNPSDRINDIRKLSTILGYLLSTGSRW